MAISVVQTKTNTGTTGTTLNVTLTATSAGNSLIVAAAEYQSGGAPGSITGITAGAASFTAGPFDQDISGNVVAEIWSADNIPSGITTVTITYLQANTDITATVYEVSGLNSAGSIDKAAEGDNDSATTPISWTSNTTVTLTSASEIAVGSTSQAAAITAITGPAGGWTNTALTSGSLKSMAGQNIVSATTGLAYSGTSTHTGTADTATVIGTFKAASAGGIPAGRVQPQATVPVPRRKPGRGLWGGIAGDPFVAVPAPRQQPSPARRRRPSRAYVRFTPVTTANAIPAPPTAGTVQPRATVPVPRRQPGRGLWRRITGAAYVAVAPPGQQPRPAPRRTPGRALWRGNAVQTPVPIQIQTQQHPLLPRRVRARAVWRGITGAARVAVPAPVQQYRPVPRRKLSRAWVRFTPVRTANQLLPRTLLISLASKAGTDDYGNAFPQGILATAGIIEGPTFIGPDFIINPSGSFFYSGSPAAGNLTSSTAPAAGTDGFGNNFLAGPATYDDSGGIATALAAGFVAFYSGSLAGGWSALSSVAGDVAGNVQVNAAGELQLIGSGGVTINGSNQTGGPSDTGFFNTQGLASGAYGATHQHTLPNFPQADHTHTL